MHIYVHVPFCARRCSYCDFAIAVRREVPNQQFAAAITGEWRSRSGEWRAAAAIDTLYFGGGTPSRLAPASLGAIIAAIAGDLPLAAGAEVTLEANPDDITEERAHAWASTGVNRISLGVQSHDPDVLQWMHRTHRAEQVPHAVRALRAAGIENISMDLIFALPAALERDWGGDLRATIELQPTHLSLYGLTVEPHTPLSRWTERGATITLPDERYATEFLEAHAILGAAGYEYYEVSNAARPGFRSRHNSAYWSGADYIGLGPSAHSFLHGERRWNVREWAEYQARSAAGTTVVGGAESLEPDARALERRYLGLRTSDGLEVGELAPETAQRWCREGWASVSSDRLRLTPEGWLRLDALVGAALHS